MYRLLMAIALTGWLSFAGCGSEANRGDRKENAPAAPASQTEGSGLNIKIPEAGVDVNVGGGNGVGVKAPGVDVNVDQRSGVKVKAPGVKVESEP